LPSDEELREHRITVVEQDFKAILSRLDGLLKGHESLISEVSTWAAAQKEQNHSVAALQKDFNDHLRSRNLNCPLLDTHKDDHEMVQQIKKAKDSVWLSQWKVISAAMGTGGGIAVAVVYAADKLLR